MKYPYTIASVKLYEQSDDQLQELAYQAVRVAEPKKVRFAFQAAIAACAISIVGLPIALFIGVWREDMENDDADRKFNNLKSFRDMQIMYHLEDEVDIHWRGNAPPGFCLKGESLMVWNVLQEDPDISSSRLQRLRDSWTRPVAPLRPAAMATATHSSPPSYGALFAQMPPPNYDEVIYNDLRH